MIIIRFQRISYTELGKKTFPMYIAMMTKSILFAIVSGLCKNKTTIVKRNNTIYPDNEYLQTM